MIKNSTIINGNSNKNVDSTADVTIDPATSKMPNLQFGAKEACKAEEGIK